MDILKEKEDIKLEKIFIIFLILHLVVWSTICLIRQIMPIDAMECVYWGSFADFGTNKHPPLAGWMAYFVYNLFHKTASRVGKNVICHLFKFVATFLLVCTLRFIHTACLHVCFVVSRRVRHLTHQAIVEQCLSNKHNNKQACKTCPF